MSAPVFYKWLRQPVPPEKAPVADFTGKAWPPIGEWTKPVSGRLRMCFNGYHVCTRAQLVTWLPKYLPGTLYVAEIGDEFIVREGGDQHCARTARLVSVVGTFGPEDARPFAIDCAERVLPLYKDIGGDHAVAHSALKDARDRIEAEWRARLLPRPDDRAPPNDVHTQTLEAIYTAAEGIVERRPRGPTYETRLLLKVMKAASRAMYQHAGEAGFLAEREWQHARLLEIIGAA